LRKRLPVGYFKYVLIFTDRERSSTFSFYFVLMSFVNVSVRIMRSSFVR